jgi:hypothetical protein
MTSQPTIETYLMDMDGVLVHEERLIPGADQFISRLQDTGHRFLVLTNNSIYTPRDLDPPRPGRPPDRHRPAGPRAGHLDLGPGHRPVPRHPAPPGQRLCDRGGRADHRPARAGLRAQ